VTKRKAELLTGYEIRAVPNGTDLVCYSAFDADRLIATVQHRHDRVALTQLVNVIYQMHSRQVLDEYGWKCARCGERYLLQIHHRKFRSHGGTHRRENLEPVCSDCHRLIHARERSRLNGPYEQ
jgi:HNH endonuclease